MSRRLRGVPLLAAAPLAVVVPTPEDSPTRYAVAVEPQLRKASARSEVWMMARAITESVNADAATRLDEVVSAVSDGRGRVRVEKAGVTVAAVVSAADLDLLEDLDRRNATHRQVLDHVREAFADVSSDELLQKAVETVREVRAEMRAERLAAEAAAAKGG